MNTRIEVLGFIADYQRVFRYPPTLNEITQGCTSLNWRSSARYVTESLVQQGDLEVIAPTNCARRYAVPDREL